jgi:hypothetical protein
MGTISERDTFPTRDAESPLARKKVITTLYFPRRAAWSERVDMLDVEAASGVSVASRLVRESTCYEAMVLNGDGAPIGELAAAAMIGRRRKPPIVIIADCAWGLGATRIGGIIDRTAVRLIDGPHVHYCVHSREHQLFFPDLWGVAEERVHVNHYYYTLSEEELAMDTQRDGSIFSGGRSKRDFSTLIEAVGRISAPVTIGGQVSSKDRRRLPRNVRAEFFAHEEFISLLCRASVVVVSLEQTNRSAGEQTYLNAMAMGKPVIVSDTFGVRDYIEHAETGLIVPPRDIDALTAAIEWTLDSANEAEVRRMGDRGRDVALSCFSPDNYIADLLTVVDQVLAETSKSPSRSTMPTGTRVSRKRTLQRSMRVAYRIVAASPLRPILDSNLIRRLKRRSLEMPADGVPAVFTALQLAGLSVWLVGGWGIDALLGEQTRRHRDLDVVLEAGRDAEQRAVKALEGLGFKFVKREAVPGSDPGCWLSTRLVLADDAGHLLDLHPVRFPLVVMSGGAERRFSPEDAFVTGSVGGRQVPCLSAPLQFALHEGYEARDIDREDVARLLGVG